MDIQLFMQSPADICFHCIFMYINDRFLDTFTGLKITCSFKQRLTDLENELVVIVGKNGGWDRVWDGHVHSGVFKMDITNKGLLYKRELCSVLCGRGVWGERPHVYACPSPFSAHLRLSQHGKEVLEGGDVCTPMADSCWCMAESSTIL